MAFENGEADYANTARTGFGAQPPPAGRKTADIDTQSALCPKCRQETVKDEDIEDAGICASGIKPVCTNPDCDWKGKTQLI